MDSGFGSEDVDNVENFQTICDLLIEEDKENEEPKSILKGSIDILGAPALPVVKSVTFSPTDILHEIPHRPNWNPNSPRMPVRKKKSKPIRTSAPIAMTAPNLAKPKVRGHRRTSSYSSSLIVKELNRDNEVIAYCKTSSRFTTQVEKEERQRLLDAADQMVQTPIDLITAGTLMSSSKIFRDRIQEMS